MDTLTETPTGTHVTMRFERPRSTKDRAFLEALFPQIEPMFHAGVASLEPLLAEEMARRAAADALAPEAVGPVSQDRFRTGALDGQPVDSAPVHSS
jgi:hypothetical protein